MYCIGNRINSKNIKKLDLLNNSNLKKTLNKFKPDIIIHLAAITDVDLCQKNINLAYKTNVLMELFRKSNVILAFKWNGDLLSAEHGGPVRALLPGQYFWKSAKWIRRIEFTEEDRPGYWEMRGYHNIGDPWKEERYHDD